MDPIGAITIDSAGAVTRPSSMPFALPAASSQSAYNRYGLMSMVPMPSERGLMFANGIDRIRHYNGSTAYDNGLVAPVAAPTATPSGGQATTVLNTANGGTYTISDMTYMILIDTTPALELNHTVRFVTSRSSFGYPNSYVYYDGTTDNALTQLEKFINQTGVDGQDYLTNLDFSTRLTATKISSTKLQLTAKDYGTIGNGYACEFYPAIVPSPSTIVRFENLAGSSAQTTFSGGAAASGSSPSPGTYQYAYAYVREGDGAVSGLSPVVEAANGSGGSVTIGSLAVSPPDSSVSYIRIYRTTAGGGLFYRLDEVSAATTSYVDSISDSTMTSFGAVAYDPSSFRSFAGGVPPKTRYLAHYQGSWFGSGALLSADYTAGTANVSASRTVTITGGYPRQSWLGRLFQVTGVSEVYRIVAVSESAKTLTLDRPYEGAANASASYVVKDDRDPYELFWSEAGLPNNWPAQNSLKGPSSPDGKGCTGLFAAFESLIYFTRQSVWRITGSGGLYQVSLVSDKCGCVSGHTVVMDGTGMFWLGQDGVYGWSGSGEPVNLTTPLQQDVSVRGQDETIARLSLAHSHRAVGINDQTRKELRWYVPLDGERTNRYAIVLDSQAGVFSLDTCEDVTWSVTAQGPDGEDHVLTGDITGAIYEQGLSTADGGYGVEPVNTVSSSTTRTVTVAGTPFSTADNGYWGCPVWHVSAAGLFVRNSVATNTNNTLTYRRFMAAPSSSTQFVLGGILMWIQTGRFDFGDRFREKVVPAYIVSHSPDSDGQYFFFSAYDQSAWATPTLGWTSGDLTVGNTQDDFGPRRRFRARKQAVLHAYGIACIEPGCSPEFSSVTIEVRGPSNLDL